MPKAGRQRWGRKAAQLVLATAGVLLVSCGSPKAVRGISSKGVYYSVPTEAPVVALTIDDGPDAETTPEILDVLRDNGVHATFFIVGNRIPGNEAILQRMVDEGHELGNHTLDLTPSVLKRSDKLRESLRETERRLLPFGGKPRWFRPASGFYTDKTLSVAKELGYETALADVFSGDIFLVALAWQAGFIRERTKPGSIIVLHDGGVFGRRTSEVLRRVLPDLKARGYRVTTLSEVAGWE